MLFEHDHNLTWRWRGGGGVAAGVVVVVFGVEDDLYGVTGLCATIGMWLCTTFFRPLIPLLSLTAAAAADANVNTGLTTLGFPFSISTPVKSINKYS